MKFGDFVKQLRLRKKQTLRRFCLEHGFDPGNHSKIERGILPPPKDEKKLTQLAISLGLKEGAEDWQTFFDLAIISNGKLPDYVMSDAELLGKLPLLFRTVKGEKISAEKLDKLIELIKES
jgi:transcriptional regulator with XRE-family HTH domain